MNSVGIKSWKIKEKTPVYDIEVPGNHNFILSNGVIAHNCSHSTSYAIVAYNGCYIKHHYPLHFWKGELTINSGDHDELKECLKECGGLVLGVDIAKSHPTEWTIEDGKLRAPLSLIKGCGALSMNNLRLFMEGKLNEIEEIKEEVEAEDDKLVE
jgi:DNA polymerase III subunit alpha